MELRALDTIISGLMDGLPSEVTDSLSDVEVLVVETPADGTKALISDAVSAAREEGNTTMTAEEMKELTLAADCKGCFLGDPMEKTDDQDPDAEESDVVYDPEGYMVFCACNIENEDAAVLIFLHELGHALGLDEDEVKELGLAVSQAKNQGKAGADGSPEHSPNG
jgi:predicted Zn-dependent protease with MMP-like domain